MKEEIAAQLTYLTNLIDKEQTVYNNAMMMADQATTRISAYGVGIDCLNEVLRSLDKASDLRSRE